MVNLHEFSETRIFHLPLSRELKYNYANLSKKGIRHNFSWIESHWRKGIKIHGLPVRWGRLVLLANSMPCGFLAAWTLASDEFELQQPLLSSFPWSVGLSEHMQMDWQRNWKRITVWAMGIALELSLKEAKSCKMCTIASVIQQIPKMAVTVTTIKVTRFRTLNTPCVRKVMALSRWYYTRRMLSFILLWSVIILL